MTRTPAGTRPTGPDPYGRDVLAARRPKVIPEIPATAEVVAEDPLSGFCGAVVACTSTRGHAGGPAGRRRMFPLDPGAFLVDGQQVTLVRPQAGRAGRRAVRVRFPGRSPGCAPGPPGPPGSGWRASTTRRWSSGSGDTTCGSRASSSNRSTAWTTCRRRSPSSGPGPARRLGVLVDHLVPRLEGEPDRRRARRGSAHRADHRASVHRHLAGGPAVRGRHPGLAGGAARRPTGRPGSARPLGISDPRGDVGPDERAVRSYRDLDTPLITAVEQLIDFVTVPED